MKLVGERHEERQPAQQDEQVVARLDDVIVVQRKVIAHEAEYWHHGHAAVRVALNDVMTRNGRRVNMVLSERADERLRTTRARAGEGVETMTTEFRTAANTLNT